MLISLETGVELSWSSYSPAPTCSCCPGTGGLAVQQAMRWGLPVIAAQGDGTLDDLVQPENGWRVPPGDLQALTRTLQSALEDLPRLRRMGQASFQIVQEQANIEKMVEVFIQALNAASTQVDEKDGTRINTDGTDERG